MSLVLYPDHEVTDETALRRRSELMEARTAPHNGVTTVIAAALLITALPLFGQQPPALPASACGSELTARVDGRGSTIYRVTLVYVADNQNITLSLPRALLKRVKRVAADRDTSVSALMTEALGRVADEDRRYAAARKRALTALRSPRSLGTQGRRTWSRDELHER